MLLSKKLGELRQRAQASHRELVEIERLPGIADAAEKIRTEPPNYFAIYDAAERHSDEQRELEAAEEEAQQRRSQRRLRNLYFDVGDIELRKRLIAKDREGGDIAVQFFQQELADAAGALETARSSQKNWWVWVAIVGIASIAFGYYLFGLVGALGGLLVGFFNGRHAEQEASRARETAVAEAERELTEAQEAWDRVRNEPQMFSQREVRSGEPDAQGGRARVVE